MPGTEGSPSRHFVAVRNLKMEVSEGETMARRLQTDLVSDSGCLLVPLTRFVMVWPQPTLLHSATLCQALAPPRPGRAQWKVYVIPQRNASPQVPSLPAPILTVPAAGKQGVPNFCLGSICQAPGHSPGERVPGRALWQRSHSQAALAGNQLGPGAG